MPVRRSFNYHNRDNHVKAPAQQSAHNPPTFRLTHRQTTPWDWPLSPAGKISFHRSRLFPIAPCGIAPHALRNTQNYPPPQRRLSGLTLRGTGNDGRDNPLHDCTAPATGEHPPDAQAATAHAHATLHLPAVSSGAGNYKNITPASQSQQITGVYKVIETITSQPIPTPLSTNRQEATKR